MRSLIVGLSARGGRILRTCLLGKISLYGRVFRRFRPPRPCLIQGLLAVAILVSSGLAMAEPDPPEGDALPSQRRSALVRGRIELDATGSLFVPGPPSGSEATADSARTTPIVMQGRFSFVQRRGETTAPLPVVAKRLFSEAHAVFTLDAGSVRHSLPADARSILLARLGTAVVPFLDIGFLTREERDLLDWPFDPLLLEALLPPDSLENGASWTIDGDDTAGLLAIDTIETGGLRATLDRDPDKTVVMLSGRVEGGVDGVPTQVEVEARLVARAVGGGLFIESLTGVVRERRQASHVAPGFDVEAAVRIVLHHVGETDSLPENSPPADGGGDTAGEKSEHQPSARGPAASSPRRPAPGQPGRLWFADRHGRFDLVYDDRWRIVEDGESGCVMRLVDHGGLIGQASLTPLPPGGDDGPTLETVQRDIEAALTGQFNHVESAAESARSNGERIIRVVSSGEADGLPFSWIHYVLWNPAGRRVAVSFMIEEASRERFLAADREFLDGLRLDPRGAARAGSTPP
jgi:hypothetical protein